MDRRPFVRGALAPHMLPLLLLFGFAGGPGAREAAPGAAAHAEAKPAAAQPAAAKPAAARAAARKQRGKASYYSGRLAGRKTASGKPLDPQAHTAASRTLPIGTKARVKNLRTGDSTVVTITDRGPVPKDRVIDVTPKVADKLDLKEDGVAPVEVTPLKLPKRDGAANEPGGGAKD